MEKERADSKNAVEEYVYEMRDKLSGALCQFMVDAVRIFSCSYLSKDNSCEDRPAHVAEWLTHSAAMFSRA